MIAAIRGPYCAGASTPSGATPHTTVPQPHRPVAAPSSDLLVFSDPHRDLGQINTWRRTSPVSAAPVSPLPYPPHIGARQEVICRENEDLPPHTAVLGSPYDPDTRYSVKRDTGWDGYKVQLGETCEDIAVTGAPHLVTNVATTPATVPGVAMTTTIHTGLAPRPCS